VFDLLNLWNPNPKAVTIARGTLSAICRAVNVLTPKDTSELHNKPLRITVGIQKGEGDYNDQNKIKSYKPRQVGGPAPAAFDAHAAAAASNAETVATLPW
jgi:hypothetical protein